MGAPLASLGWLCRPEAASCSYTCLSVAEHMRWHTLINGQLSGSVSNQLHMQRPLDVSWHQPGFKLQSESACPHIHYNQSLHPRTACARAAGRCRPTCRRVWQDRPGHHASAWQVGQPSCGAPKVGVQTGPQVGARAGRLQPVLPRRVAHPAGQPLLVSGPASLMTRTAAAQHHSPGQCTG